MTQIEKHKHLYDTLIIKDRVTDYAGRLIIKDVKGQVEAKVNKMISNINRYKKVSHQFPNPGLKWWVVALLHEMEGSQNFNTYLGNGQPINKVTTIVPIGRGPFKTFEEGAVDAIKLDGLNNMTDWSIGNLLYKLEGFNGYGYSKFKGINSPYLYSGSNHYTSGKYIADGLYAQAAVSSQIGIALMIKRLDSIYKLF